MHELKLWNDYSREDVHGIFSPTTVFTPQAGTWGLQGMVRIPDRAGDWVFFVTFGQEQGEHVFDESITDDGVLSWQSQPAQKLKDETILELIRHDERINNIHLFLRTKSRSPYCYLGTLGYLTHDSVRERPVHFQWQLLDWPAPPGQVERIGLRLLPVQSNRLATPASLPSNVLIMVEPPAVKPTRAGVSTQEFQKRKAPDYAAKDERNRQLGLKGELLVLANEKARLIAANREDLAALVVHTSVVEGDGAGYDIRSFEMDGSVRHIEVKTTEGGDTTAFYISPNEVGFSARNPKTYFLFRLYEYDASLNSAKSYVLRGDISQSLHLTATAFRAELRSSSIS
jgi:hypothetical protein